MFSRSKKYFLISLGALIFCGVFFSSVVRADDFGLDATAEKTAIPMDVTIPGIVGNAIGTALSLISVLFFGLMLYGGFVWMTAQGNSQAETKAKDIIISAIIGILIVLKNLAPGGGGGETSNTTATNNTPAITCAKFSGLTCLPQASCKAGTGAQIKTITDAAGGITASGAKFSGTTDFISGMCPGSDVCCIKS